MGMRHTHAGAKHCSGQLAKPKGNLPEPVRAAGRKPVDVAYTDQHEARTGGAWAGLADRRSYRSEEHTSELQSLMRISYAVFCLKKKKKQSRVPTQNKTKKNTQP